MSKILAVEIDGPRNDELYFAPIQKRLRGKIELSRMTNGYRLGNRFPFSIPGQRVEYDLSADTCVIVDGIHDDESVKTAIEKQGFAIPAKREELGKVDRPTFLFWLKRAVESGIAKITQGAIPEIKGTPQTHFVTDEVKDDTRDRMTAALENQSAMLEKMALVLERLAK